MLRRRMMPRARSPHPRGANRLEAGLQQRERNKDLGPSAPRSSNSRARGDRKRRREHRSDNGDKDMEEGEDQNNNSGESDGASPKEDNVFCPELGRKETKGKKRKARGEEKKGRKKKKKRKNESEEEHGLEVKAAADSRDGDDAPSAVPSNKGSSSKHNTSSAVPSDSGSRMPTVEEVCSTFGLNDVDVQYSESDLKKLTCYQSFRHHVIPLLVEANPKVSLLLRLMMLAAAKWRLFSKTNPHYIEGGSRDNTNTSTVSYFAPKWPGGAPKEIKEEEQEGSRGANLVSDADIEQMLAEANEPNPVSSTAEQSAQPKDVLLMLNPNAPPQPKKAKTKIGNNTRKKKKLKSTNKFPDGAKGEQENQNYYEEEEQVRSRGANSDSVAEFEHTPAAAEPKPGSSHAGESAQPEQHDPDAPPKKSSNKVPENGAEEKQENQYYCEVCKQSLACLVCNTCPRTYHPMCLKLQTEEVKRLVEFLERRWSCPHCESEDKQDQPDEDVHETCWLCNNSIVCCDSCPLSYHQFCLNPPLERLPDGDWYCPQCSSQPRKFPDDAEGKPENQDYCEVCKQRALVIVCKTCPRTYHPMCLKLQTEEVKRLVEFLERRWSCPHCESEDKQDQPDEDVHETCWICKNGPVFCESCPLSYHQFCLNPPLERLPDREWYCPGCSEEEQVRSRGANSDSVAEFEHTPAAAEPKPGSSQAQPEQHDPDAPCLPRDKVASVLTWRWRESSAESETPRSREFFVKWHDYSYWYCSWISEIQLKEFEPLMYRCYMRNLKHMRFMTRFEKIIEERPEKRDGLDSLLDWERRDTGEEMFRKYYRYGIKPEWLQVHRVINQCTSRDGTTYYMVKWRDLPYDQVTWEPEHYHIAGFKDAVEYYQDMRAHITSEGKSKGSKGKKGCKSKNKDNVDNDETSSGLQVKAGKYTPPPDRPIADLYEKYEDQPPFAHETGMQLHPYQREGLNWLRHSWGHGIDAILADDKGLGKTIQTVAFLYSLFKEGHSKGPFLVSVPRSRIIDWEREFELWAPDLYVVTYGCNRISRAVIRDNELAFDDVTNRDGPPSSIVKSQVKFNVLLTPNELISIDDDELCLGSIDWAVLVVDVASSLKSSQPKYFRVLTGYHINYKILLTGTSLENNLKELFYLLNFLNKDKFCDLAAFQNEFADSSKEEQVKRLHEILGPHMLRRLKADVLKNMSTKSEFIVHVELSPMQKKYYKYILTRNYENLYPKNALSTDLNFVMDELKKCCNHPYLFPEVSEEAPVGLYGFYDTQAMIKASGKLVLLSKMLRQLKEQGHKVLIMSEKKKMLDILEEFLLGEGYKYERIDGDISGTIRRKAIHRFNAPGAQQFVFLMWTKVEAAGLGINLATADTVIIYDCFWDSHNDIQAYLRAHRIGEANKGMIYRFVTRNSLEERLTQVAKRKMMLTHAIVRPGMGGKGTNFTKKELDDILRFGTEELFKEEEDKEEAIHYDDKAVGDLLDWSREGIDQKEYWAKEYLSSFKVANYSTKGETEKEVDTEKIKQEAENTDPAYWIKLLRHHYQKYEEEKIVERSRFLGKGKRVRNVVKYSLSK